ncbi:MAG: response regulator [Candidatus Riflebacteria bacterium]|nr:response regulator [Candidatus Riflebacteria bacterium]
MNKQKILVIEDEEDVLEGIVELLSSDGFLVDAAKCADSGMKCLSKSLPDVIVCDIMMPGMNGYEFLKILKNEPRTAVIPFIFLTARGNRNSHRTGMELGADDYIVKPFSKAELTTSIQSQISKRSLLTKSIDQLKADIGAMLPHEFRTPLSGILGFAEIIKSAAAENKQIDIDDLKHYADIIYQSGQRILQLVKKQEEYFQLISQLAKKSENTVSSFKSHIQQFTISTILQNIASRLERKADLVIDIEEAEVKIPFEYLCKILSELTDNALKFSKPATEIKITGKSKDSRYILTISDKGHGMAPSQIAQITAYRQFDRNKYEQQGMGLGLATIKAISELYSFPLVVNTNKDGGLSVEMQFEIS